MSENRPRRLTRSRDSKIAGVAGGIAEYFDLDPTVVRLIWLVAGVFSAGSAVLAYILFWIVMPEAPAGGTEGEERRREPPHDDDRSRTLLAIVLVVAAFFVLAGAVVPFSIFTARVFMPGFFPGFLWPLSIAVLLVLLILLAVGAFRREPR